jgi:hypothetical protein
VVTWKVKSKNADGSESETLADTWSQALDLLADQRARGKDARVEDTTGKKVDERTGMPKPVYAAALYEGLDGKGRLIAGPEIVGAKDDADTAQVAMTWAKGKLEGSLKQECLVKIMKNGTQFDQRMIAKVH